MTIQTFIERAIEGGYPKIVDTEPPVHCKVASEGMSAWLYAEEEDGTAAHIPLHNILLDPEAWKAVGKVEGWSKGLKGYSREVPWQTNMHRMIDALAEGKTISEFLATL